MSTQSRLTTFNLKLNSYLTSRTHRLFIGIFLPPLLCSIIVIILSQLGFDDLNAGLTVIIYAYIFGGTQSLLFALTIEFWLLKRNVNLDKKFNSLLIFSILSGILSPLAALPALFLFPILIFICPIVALLISNMMFNSKYAHNEIDIKRIKPAFDKILKRKTLIVLASITTSLVLYFYSLPFLNKNTLAIALSIVSSILMFSIISYVLFKLFNSKVNYRRCCISSCLANAIAAIITLVINYTYVLTGGFFSVIFLLLIFFISCLTMTLLLTYYLTKKTLCEEAKS